MCDPIVRMFYSNIIEHDLDESYLKSSFFGIVVKVTPEVIAKVLGIPLVEAPSVSDLEITFELLDRVSIDLWGEVRGFCPRIAKEGDCECLARLAIPDKIPKCPLTRFTNPSLDYSTLKTKTLLRGRGDNEASENSAKAMYSIFNVISTDEFRRITTCTSAKEAWDILQVTHEGTSAVKVSKLQMLTSRFETIRMDDHKTFREFHAKLMDIVNSNFNPGEPISNSKVVRKILRSLPKRFRAKVTAIEESKDVESLKIDELVGSLQTFEMTLVSPRKAKEIALKAIKEESLSSESEDDEKMSEVELTKFAKNFKNSIGKEKKMEKGVKKELKFECFKCGGKGHYAFECPSKKKDKNAMQVTWSDSESNQSSEKESNRSDECTNFIAFVASVNEEPFLKEASSESSDSNDDDMSFDTTYETLH
uniref:CCHC-type domain-containing protein n=1 Tax=Vitis vinifera TaxID=29760 RepID=A5BPJ5_VITVI|nr:hypothetical protein VITISV_012791 [Vitis vinifera]